MPRRSATSGRRPSAGSRVPGPHPRLFDRLATGRPLKVSELVEYGCGSRSWLHKLIGAGVLRAGRIGAHYTISVQEAERIARETGVLLE